MKENDKINQDFQKGFNEGYLIAKHLPQLSESLAKTTGDSERLNGILEGRNQFILDQSKEHYPSWLKDAGQINKQSKTKSKEQDRDNRE